MTQEEFEDWIDNMGTVLRTLAVFVAFVLICGLAGYFITKMEQSEMKKTVPDCGSCRVYKEGVKK